MIQSGGESSNIEQSLRAALTKNQRVGLPVNGSPGIFQSWRLRPACVVTSKTAIPGEETMKTLITDYTFSDVKIEKELLDAAGVSLQASRACPTLDQLCEFVADADAVITQFAPITAPVIEQMQRARVIVRYGIGVDNVDLNAAAACGIPVCNVPDYCIDEVADHTLAFILALTRQVVSNAQLIQSGGWGLAGGLQRMTALRGRSAGLVGFGRIGREVAHRLLAFGCSVQVYDPVVSDDEVFEQGCTPLSLSDVLKNSDIVSLHCPSTEQTRGMLNAETLQSMRYGALLINVARGDLVDTAALADCLETGHLAGAALDVFSPEPLPAEHRLRTLPNVIAASHIASASETAVRRLRETAVQIAIQALQGERPDNIVNGVK